MRAMNSDIEWTIRKVLANVLEGAMTVEEISANADLIDEYGLDSLQMISFLLGIEDAFDVELDYENLQLDHLRSVCEFAGFLANLRVLG